MATPLPVAWLDGRLQPLAEARVSPLDRGYLFGDGIYEVMPVFDGRVYLLDQHLDRLDRSLREVRIPAPHTRDEWRRICGALVQANGGGSSYLYLQVSRGFEFARNHVPPAGMVPAVFVFAIPLPEPVPPATDPGIACVTLPDNRWGRCDIKSISLLANVLLKWQARDAGAIECILLRDGRLMEGGSCSVLVVTDGVVRTPPDSPERLPGTTCALTMTLARRAGYRTEVREITEAELRSADEVWATASVMGLRPVTRLDGRPVGAGTPGPVFRSVGGLVEATKLEFSTECRP